MSARAREPKPEEENKAAPAEEAQKPFRIIFKPPEGHPTTFTGTRMETDPDTGEDVPVEVEREYLMDMTVLAKSPEAAKFYAERHAFNLAVQEAGSEDPDEVLAQQWVVESVEEDKPAEE
jgi:hypothetical protein